MKATDLIRPTQSVTASVTDALAVFEDAVARLTSTAAELSADDTPWAVAQREEAADRAVDLLAARAWYAKPSSSLGDVQAVAHRCVAYAVVADTVLAGGRDSSDRSVQHRLTGRALLLLTLPEHFDAVTGHVRHLLGAAPEGRLLAAWRMVDEALGTLDTTRHEWVGADPAVVAAAGWVLVDRMSRLLIASALVSQAGAAGQPSQVAELLVNAARRYAWNHLRRPAPEAATPTHVRRSADLVSALAPQTRREQQR
ncbi:hypothetical protein [Umezawaea sp. Da 62-37]|uniref:hypothetical protein n=1 Tax=Umezawaea sp. Da 62-37 TaxID=3075927 RepID=UPI0028F6C933|nr:hypothetical protein [Umezawaea sp. Da 62-37]WNV84945.1 hypothetical protein RM788_43455 [Umezawaea sp. Da 62-37]